MNQITAAEASAFEYIRSTYKVPARRGGRIRYTGDPKGAKLGTIMAAEGAYISVRFDGELIELPLHPTWAIIYLDAAQAGGAT